MKFLLPFAVLILLFSAACGTTETPTPPPPPTERVVPTTNAGATETAITIRVLATLTANAPTLVPSVPPPADTVTPPPLPNTATPNIPASPTAPLPTLSSNLSPSVTPIPALPTKIPPPAPTQPPSPPPPPQVSQEALRGKIMFRSARNGGKYPDRYQYFAMNADGSEVQQLERNAAEALYNQLRPLEGYSPDKSLLVVGDEPCGGTGRCDLYVGPPDVVIKRSQGQWTPSNRRYRFYDPVWSPDGGWIAFIWNNSDDKTKNIFKGPPQSNPSFVRLTDFLAGKDTKRPTFSPDGRMLAFATQDGPLWQIWVLNVNAENPTDAAAHNVSISDYDDWDPLWIK